MLWLRFLGIIEFILIGLLVGPSSASAKTLYVDSSRNGPDGLSWESAFKTLSGAVSAATGGDEIWVRRGSYGERVELKRNVSLFGGFEGNESNRNERNPDPTRTIIRKREFNKSVVEGAEGAVLDGFTITGGLAYEGGGLRCVGCSMTVRNCRIVDNQAHITFTLSCGYGFCVPVAVAGGRGAGVYLESASPTFANCVVESNTVDQDYAAYFDVPASGILSIESTPHFNNCYLAANEGAGLSIRGGTVELNGCALEDNRVRPGYSLQPHRGNGVRLEGGAVIIANSTLSENFGAAIWGTEARVEAFNSLFQANKQGAVRVEGEANFTNCTISGNDLYDGVGGIVSFGGALAVRNSILWNVGTEILAETAEVAYSCVQRGFPGEGNIEVWPAFRDYPNGDWRLSDGSPCIDSGNNDFLSREIAIDLGGNPRRLGAASDIGAFEAPADFVQGATEWAPTVLEVRSAANDGTDGTQGTYLDSIEDAVFRSVRGSEIRVASGRYQESVYLESDLRIVGGFPGAATGSLEQDPPLFETILEGTSQDAQAFLAEAVSGVTLENLTFDGSVYRRSAVTVSGATLALRDCRFRKFPSTCVTCSSGGNLHVNACTFDDNGTPLSAGVLEFDRAGGHVSGSTFTSNACSGSRGVVYSLHSDLVIADSLIADNTANGVWIVGGTTELVGGAIENNRGEGIHLYSRTVRCDRLVVRGNDLAGIKGRSFTFPGRFHLESCLVAENGEGGIDLERFTDLEAVNCTIVGNRSSEGAAGTRIPSDGSGALSNCILWNYGEEISGSSVEVFFSTIKGGFPGEGNSMEWPEFVDDIGDDWSLRNGSPCIDAGNENFRPSGVLDLAGNRRTRGVRIDRGAYESSGSFVQGEGQIPPRRFHVRVGGSGNRTGENWKNTFPASQLASLRVVGASEAWLAKGLYPVNLRIGGNLSIVGGFSGYEKTPEDRVLDDEWTVLDGGGKGSVIAANQVKNLSLDRLLISGGGSGGGVKVSNGSLNIHDCRIEGNGPSLWAGGVALAKGSLDISGSTVTRNEGVGVSFSESAAAITDTLVEENLAIPGAMGGIALSNSELKLVRSAIRGHEGVGSGGGVHAEASKVEIENCTIEANVVSGMGGGCWGDAKTDWNIRGSVIARNHADEGGAFSGQRATFANCNLVWNSAEGMVGGVWVKDATIANSILWNKGVELATGVLVGTGNSTVLPKLRVFQSIVQGGWEAPNVLAFNPRFRNVETGDYRLAEGSPCIDRGTAVAGLPSTDIAGNPRILGGVIDIGAIEAPTSIAPDDPPHPRLFVRPSGNLKGPGTNWSDAFDSVSRASLFAFGPTEIWVEEGSYNDSLFVETPTRLHGGFRGFETDIGQRETDFRRSVLDGGGKGSGVLRFFSTRGNLVDGFRIEGGKSDLGGGGVSIEYSEVVLANCEIADNTATQCGGGVLVQTSSVYVVDSRIVGNTAGSSDRNETGFGAGVYTSGSPLRIVNSLIEKNRAHRTGSDGGGLYANRGVVELFGVTIRDNRAEDGGGAIAKSGSRIEFDRCRVTGNRADSFAGGIGIEGGRIVIRNTAVWGNTAQMDGGLTGRDPSGLWIENSTFFGNSPNNGTFNRKYSSYETIVRNSIFWGGTQSNISADTVPIFYSDIQGGFPGEGNIDADPLFIAPEKGDFRLAAGSPCIDSGTVVGPAIDFEGRPRPVDIPGLGQEGTGGEFDMGAFERPVEGYFETLVDEDRNGWVDARDLLESLETGYDEKTSVPYLFYYALQWRTDVSNPSLLSRLGL